MKKLILPVILGGLCLSGMCGFGILYGMQKRNLNVDQSLVKEYVQNQLMDSNADNKKEETDKRDEQNKETVSNKPEESKGSFNHESENQNDDPALKSRPVQNEESSEPQKDGDTIYEIVWGDTLCEISKKFGHSVDSIANRNEIRNVNRIYAGSVLQIPEN